MFQQAGEGATAMEVDASGDKAVLPECLGVSAAQFAKMVKQLLTYAARLGKVLAELFTLLGKVIYDLLHVRANSLPFMDRILFFVVFRDIT